MKDTAATIAAVQRSDGGIPWYAGGPLDPWNHTEAAMGLDAAGRHAEAEAAYDWLAANQNPDGSWCAEYRDGLVADSARDTNFTAYAAVGVRHHALVTGDAGFLHRLWPVVERVLEFVTSVQRADGPIPWRVGEDGTPRPEALVAGCSSIHHALRHGVAVAAGLGSKRDDWARAADALRASITGHRDRYTAKPHSMDWYCPVLGSVVNGSAATAWIAAEWDRFVVPGLGVRCVHDQPWVTGGETAELALTLAARGETRRAAALLAGIERLRHDDGSYWTGYQYVNRVRWPDERKTWTAGAVLLAYSALSADPATLTLFGE